jgi:transcriptional regulator with XRE-family HTH domain
VPASGSPTVRRRRLAAELRRLRTQSGKTANEVAGVLGWSKAKVSRYELAQSGLKPTDVQSLLDVYGVGGDHRQQLLALADEATAKGWWEAYSDVLTDEYLAFIGLEAEATSVSQWQVSVVPGLLQTERYARQIILGYREVATVPPSVIERRVEARMIRQRLLTGAEPSELAAVLDESVLRRQWGDHSVMREQLERLAEFSDRPNVTVQILPLEHLHSLAADSFVILRFGRAHETTLHDVVNTEILGSELHVEGEKDTYEFRLAFEHLTAESLSPAESRDLIIQIAREMWT